MPTFRLEGEVIIHSIHSPGTWLPNRDNLYLLIEVFNSCRRTKLTEAVFPLLIHEKFSFQKARSPTPLTHCRPFIVPFLHGISPRIEFTVCSAIKCNSSSQCQISSNQCCEDCFVHRPLVSTPNYHRPTVNSALRCRYAEMAEPKSFFYSDVANHNSRDHRAPLLRPYSAKQRLRPRSTGSGRSPNYNDLYTRGYPSNQLNYPLSKTNVTLSNWDLRERNIRDAQDRCDRYWSLYRFWQSEADRRRTRLI
ncbi:uncharacterized protein DEA37_0002223 [Paragonimus westermani]|uniref:Spermatogenesis-associated protein 6 N-terminal domain-containing protein n=1 Tax=Paragonimus westermani TaxID=34504 RepID=A0A5J4NG71_9TREM|nr:uncharacterized protein DEA37_0002223 [Paragonimus westermani]